jgi:hypothetical protein
MQEFFLSPITKTPYHPCYNTVSLLRQGVRTGTFCHCRAEGRMHVQYSSISDGISLTNKSWRTIHVAHRHDEVTEARGDGRSE